MSNLSPHLLLLGLLLVTVFTLVLYGTYRVISGLYLSFLDFSRRFRGVE